jgi:hypothetical protein
MFTFIDWLGGNLGSNMKTKLNRVKTRMETLIENKKRKNCPFFIYLKTTIITRNIVQYEMDNDFLLRLKSQWDLWICNNISGKNKCKCTFVFPLIEDLSISSYYLYAHSFMIKLNNQMQPF